MAEPKQHILVRFRPTGKLLALTVNPHIRELLENYHSKSSVVTTIRAAYALEQERGAEWTNEHVLNALQEHPEGGTIITLLEDVKSEVHRLNPKVKTVQKMDALTLAEALMVACKIVSASQNIGC